MTVLAVAGKADARVLVYPAVYALKHFGRVMIATDDGAYRRMYHGYGDFGESGGVFIRVFPRSISADEMLGEIKTYLPQFLICPVNGRIPAFADAAAVLTGYDTSMPAGNAHTKEELASGIEVAMDERDTVILPPGLNLNRVTELVLTATPLNSKTTVSAVLSDSLLRYAAKCEESKTFLPPADSFIPVLVKMLCPSVVSDENAVYAVCGGKPKTSPLPSFARK